MKSELICLGHKMTVMNPSGNYDMIEGTTLPGVPGPPPHYHATYCETFYVLEGRMEFLINDTTVIVETGDSIDLPPHTAHTFKNLGDTPCRWLNIHSPKGFLSFFQQFGVPSDLENAFEKSVGQNIIADVLKKAESFDMHLVQV